MTNKQLFDSLKAGNSVLGYSLKECRFLKEQFCRMWHLVHDKSGAELLYFEDGREEKCFTLGFPVSPDDDTGVFHIIEHCLVEASEKYKVSRWADKGPQNNMLGAFTCMDNSSYAVTSEIEQSFQDLARLYTASVFDNRIQSSDLPLLQEGWRWTYNAEKNALDYVGVVYSEMTASMEYPQFLATQVRYRAAFPNSLYSRNIGGAPESIPQLTIEQMTDTYRKFYCPANCLAVVSGETKLAEVLETLGEYFSGLARGERCVIQAVPGVWNGEPLFAEYPVLEEQNRQALMGFTWVLPDSRFSMLRGHTLARVLEGPLQIALKDFADSVQISCDMESVQPMLCITLNGTDEKTLDAIRQVILDTIASLMNSRLSEDVWEASVSEALFALQEGPGQTPSGVQNAFDAIIPFGHGKPISEQLEYLDAMEQIRAQGWEAMSDFLRLAVVENDLHSEYVLIGSATLGKRRAESRKLRVRAARNRMTQADLDEIVKTQARYQQYLQCGDDPADVDALPKTRLSDLPATPPGKEAEQRDTPLGKVLYLPSGENLIRMKLHIPVTNFEPESLYTLGVLARVLGKTDTVSHSTEQISSQLRRMTGGLECGLNFYAPDGGNLVFLEITLPILPAFFREAQQLLQELLTQSRFHRTEQLRLVLQNELGRLCGGWPEPAVRVRSHYFSGAAACQYAGGEEFKAWLTELIESFDSRADALVLQLQQTAKDLHLSDAAVSIACSPSLWEMAAAQLIFSSTLEQQHFCKMPVLPEKEIFPVGGNMQFTAQGGIPIRRTGALMAACETIRMPLRKQVRSASGAYRVAVKMNPEGDLVLETGRDPHLLLTLNAFKEVEHMIRNASDEELKAAQIAAAITFSGHSNVGIGNYRKDLDFQFAIRSYWNGMTGQKRLQVWQELLSATPEDIRNSAQQLRELTENPSCCSWASAQREQELAGTLYSPVKVH